MDEVHSLPLHAIEIRVWFWFVSLVPVIAYISPLGEKVSTIKVLCNGNLF